MFYEQPSMKSILDGFFSTKGKTKDDIKALFGFDSVHTGLPYNMLQACTLKFFELVVKQPNKNTAYHFVKKCAFGEVTVGLVFEDYNYASYIFYISNKDRYKIDFNYRTDNFPSIGIATPLGGTRYIRHLTINQEAFNDCSPFYVPTEHVLTIINGLIEVLVDMLYRAYEVYHEND